MFEIPTEPDAGLVRRFRVALAHAMLAALLLAVDRILIPLCLMLRGRELATATAADLARGESDATREHAARVVALDRAARKRQRRRSIRAPV